VNVLLTGATGYVGRRLKEKLAADANIHLRLFVRNARKLQLPPGENLEIVEGSTFEKASLLAALRGIDIAYYLVHSMGAGGDFPDLERTSALNFRDACVEAGVQRIIYLGGLGTKATASKHLLSRIETGELLSARPDFIQTLWFRAGIIVGSGSASFEIIRNLIQKLPVLLTPRWVRTKTQPISISDVLEYLHQALALDARENLIIDLGSERMSFRELLREAARVMGLKRLFLTVPLFTPRLSSYWLILITPVPYKIARALVDGLKSETVSENDNAQKYFSGIRPIPYQRAVALAMDEISQDQVLSRWCDSSAQKSCDIKDKEKTTKAVYVDRRTVNFGDILPDRIFQAFQSIGGKNGWFHYNWLWRLRGLVDKLLGGPGLSRGRRDTRELRIGDSLDFWKVMDLKKNQRLLLLSQMRLPGALGWNSQSKGGTLFRPPIFFPKGFGEGFIGIR